MPTNDEQPVRDWREIAYKIFREKDRDRRRELSQELERALEERDKKLVKDRTESSS